MPYIDESYRLLAVAEDNRRLARFQALHPPDQHFGVASVDIHAIAIDGEISEGNIIEPVHLIERAKQAFVESLRGAVECPVVIGTLPLCRRKLLGHSVDRC